MKFPVIDKERMIKKLNPPTGKIRMVLDTDTYNEVDDQFALAYALRSPEKLQVEAIYAAPFLNGKVASVKEGMEKSYDEILKIFDLLGEDSEGKVFKGSEEYLKDYDTPVESDAARDLVERAMESDEILYVVAIGAITNVASAILMEPKIIDKIVVVWLGGHPHYWPQTWEFNLMQDVLGVQMVYDCGVPLIQIPCMGVASQLTTTDQELKHYLLGKSKIGDFLTETVLGFTKDGDFFHEYNNIVNRYLEGTSDYPEDIMGKNVYQEDTYAWSKIIWDISVIGYLINPTWVHTTLVPTPVLTDDFKWNLAETRHTMRVANFIKRDSVFGDMFKKLGNG